MVRPEVLGARRLQLSRKTTVNLSIVIAAVIIIAAISMIEPRFFRLRNILNILDQTSTIGFLVIGMTCVFIVGGIDLSMPAVVSSAAVVGGAYIAQGGTIVVGCLIMIFVGLVCGAINGLAIAKARMVPFIVTLSTMILAQGFSVMFTRADSITITREAFRRIGGTVGIIPIPIIIFVVVALLLALITGKTVFGRWMYMIGTNEKAAEVSGIPVVFGKFSVYVMSGVIAAIAAIVMSAKLGAATTRMVGDTQLMDVISATVIGGASLYGGKGSVLGAFLGILFITVIANFLNLLGISYWIGMIIKGLMITIVIGLDVLRSQD